MLTTEECITALEAELERLQVSSETAKDSTAEIWIEKYGEYLRICTHQDSSSEFDRTKILLHLEDISDIIVELQVPYPVEYPIDWEGGYCDSPSQSILDCFEEFRCELKPWDKDSQFNYRRS